MKSPNFNERAGGQKPSIIILHYTGMKTGGAALERLCDPGSEVSAHYFIDEAGEVLQLVEEGKRAWHAGVAHWRGESDINSSSIGIEIVNPGHEFGYEPFPEAQMQAVISLCKSLIEKHSVAPSMVLGHSDVAPSRKLDPGHLFPWARLAQEGVGLWPVPEEMDFEAAADLLDDQDGVHRLLIEYGYDPAAEFADLMVAWHRRFCPERFAAWDDRPEQPDLEGISRLLALIRARHDEEI